MKKLLCLLLFAVPCLHAQQGTSGDAFIPTVHVGLQPVESLTIGDVTYEQVNLTGFQNNIVKFSHAVGNKSIPLVALTRAQVDALNGTSDKIVIKPGSMDLTPPSDESVQKAVALIRQAGDVDGLLPNGNTPLIEAASEGDCGILKALIMRDADLNMKTASDQSAIGAAAAGRHSNAAVMLREAGACTPDLMTAVLSGDVPMVKEYISKNRNLLKAVDRDGMTPLMRAAIEGQPEVIQALIGMGASVDETGMTEGKTPLMGASAAGRVDAMSALLSKGASVQAQDKLGWTPIMHAAAAGQKDAVTLLLSKGAKISSPGAGDVMALAREKGQTEVVDILEQMERSEKEAALAAAAKASNAAAAKVSTPPKKAVSKPETETSSPAKLSDIPNKSQKPNIPTSVVWLVVAGLVVAAIGHLWIMVLAFQEGMGWGLAILFLSPFSDLAFCCIHSDHTMKPFGILLLGLLMSGGPWVVYGFSIAQLLSS